MAFKKTLQQQIPSFIVILIFVFLWASCNPKKNSSGKEYIKLVKTAKVVKTSADEIKLYSGIIEEAEAVNLAFRVAGPIEKIYVKEGDFVKKGQLIAQMDTRDYEVQKTAVEAQVQQLQSEYKRVQELNNRKSVADNDYEKMLAGKQMAEAKLKNANDQLNDTKLHAPFSGYITKIMFDDGELVNHGTPIACMVDVSMLKVEINVPASMYINKDRITKIECTQENIPDQSFELKLYSHNVKANTNGLYKLYLHHKPMPDSKLAPGMNVSVKVTISSTDNEMYSIPINAVFHDNGASYVWVVNNTKVHQRKVETNNIVTNGAIGIISGLFDNEEVVTGGLHLLSEDEIVRIIAPKSETNIGNIL